MNRQQAWLIRPILQNKDQTQLFLDHNLIAVAVPYFTVKDRDSVLGMSQAEIHKLLSKEASKFSRKLTDKELTIFTGYLDAIANRMQIGDLVILAATKSPKVHLGKISSDYNYSGNYNANIIRPIHKDGPKDCTSSLDHTRSVAWEREMPRSELTERLRNALRVPKSVHDFSDHFEELDALIQGQDYVPQQKDVAVSYNLRPDYTIQFTIPSDMNSAEAERLSAYLKTVYFEHI